MSKQKYFSKSFSLLFLFFAFSVHAQNSEPVNVITTAVPFLRISPDAKAGGMGDVGIATLPDANSCFWNLGKIPFVDQRSAIAANFSPWLKEWSAEMFLASLTGYCKLDNGQFINAALRYFNLGNFHFTDNMGHFIQAYQPREFAIDLGYSRKLSERFGLGLGFSFIQSSLFKYNASGDNWKTANAIAANLGVYYNAKNTNGSGWSFGAAISNLGSKINYSTNSNEKNYIPANIGLGTSYTKVFNEKNRVTIGLDINKLLVPTPPRIGDSIGIASYRSKSLVKSWFSSFGDAPGGIKEELREVQLGLGVEYCINNQLAFRAGYFYEDKTKGNRKLFSSGLSIKYSDVIISFSYLFQSGRSSDMSPFANTLRFGLQVDLND